jgi:excisionase family DNA binding protein
VASESLMTVEQVADYLNVPVKTVYRWRLTGTGPRGARVGRYVRYRKATSRRGSSGESRTSMRPGPGNGGGRRAPDATGLDT